MTKRQGKVRGIMSYFETSCKGNCELVRHRWWRKREGVKEIKTQGKQGGRALGRGHLSLSVS